MTREREAIVIIDSTSDFLIALLRRVLCVFFSLFNFKWVNIRVLTFFGLIFFKFDTMTKRD
jgi:hypothetical protein